VSPLKVVADENIAWGAVVALREHGYAVGSVAKTIPAAPDEIVLQYAVSQNAVLITFDRDYGELIFKRKLAAPESVLYLRNIPASPTEMADILVGLLTGKTAGTISGYLVVWTRDGIRKRAFPGRTSA
jgi:predicted nuclease of predicted toxin-antitoxin system